MSVEQLTFTVIVIKWPKKGGGSGDGREEAYDVIKTLQRLRQKAKQTKDDSGFEAG